MFFATFLFILMMFGWQDSKTMERERKIKLEGEGKGQVTGKERERGGKEKGRGGEEKEECRSCLPTPV